MMMKKGEEKTKRVRWWGGGKLHESEFIYRNMTRKFEDILITDKPEHKYKVFKFGEYRKGSEEYGQLFQDLMMILRLKKEQNKNSDSIILTKNDLKNIDYNKLMEIIKDETKMRKLGMSFDVKIVSGGIEFSNLGNKESRPWENNQMNENKISDFFNEKLKKMIFSFIDKLSPEKYNQLKLEMQPFMGLSREEIEEKVRQKLSLNESIVDDIRKKIDPYGEEEWDEEVDLRRARKMMIRGKIAIFFAKIGTYSLLTFPFTLIMGGIMNFIDNELSRYFTYFSLIDIGVLMVSWILFFISYEMMKKAERM